MISSHLGGGMYFHWMFRLGILSLAVSIVGTHRCMWGVWLIALAAYFTIQRSADRLEPPELARTVFADSVLMQLVLVAAAAWLSGYTGALLIACGVTANYIAIACNGWRMPMLNGYSSNPCYMNGRENTPMVWLCDIFKTTQAPGHDWLISPGDVLEVIGMWTLAAELLLS